MAIIEVKATENGPYQITGPIALVDHDASVLEVSGSTIYLCRCGSSANKPFCDGAHAHIGFQGATADVNGR